MKIDNSAFSAYMKCPQLYYERYEAPNDELVQITAAGENTPRSSRGIQLIRESEAIDFGTRFHQLLHERRLRLGLRSLGLRDAGPAPARNDSTSAGGRDGNNSGGTGAEELSNGTGLEGHQPTAVPTESQPSPECPSEELEAEAQATLAAYEAHYVRDLEYLESERTHVLPLPRACPGCGGPGLSDRLGWPRELRPDERICSKCDQIFTIHELTTKLDAVVRYPDGTIGPFDTKTESRPGYNTREDWAGRTQAKIYLYALKSLYPDERVSRLTVDVVSRQSPKARRPVVFYRIDDISSSPGALEEAIRNVNYVADRIEEHRRSLWWPANMNACKKGWEKCDMYDLHIIGRTPETLKKYKPAEAYLDI